MRSLTSEPFHSASAWRCKAASIGFASRAHDQVAGQVQLHRPRHTIRRLIKMLPEEKRENLRERNFEQNLLGEGDRSVVHLVQLNAHPSDASDPFRDIDFTTSAVRERWEAGFANTRQMYRSAPLGGAGFARDWRGRARFRVTNRGLIRNTSRTRASTPRRQSNARLEGGRSTGPLHPHRAAMNGRGRCSKGRRRTPHDSSDTVRLVI